MGAGPGGRELNHVPVFLIGSPRSGTTWLQCLLGGHDAVASPQEPEFFSQYIRGLDGLWNYEMRTITDDATLARLKGISSVMTSAQFNTLVRGAVEQFHDAVLALKPDAQVVLEKCPGRHHPIDVIRRYLPEARFIHLIRDGRDVVGSLVAAAHGWGHQWAPSDVTGASEMWVDAVENACSARDAEHYLEVRYEDLLDDGPAVLEKTLAFCGVGVTRDQAAALCETFSFDQLRVDPSRPYRSVVVGGELVERRGGELSFPEGFFREGRRGAWRDTWGPYERKSFDAVAGDLLVALGYEPDHAWARNDGPDRVRAGFATGRRTVASILDRATRAAKAARRELRKRR